MFGNDGGDDGVATIALLDTRGGDAATLLMNGDWYDEDLVHEMVGRLLSDPIRRDSRRQPS